ncbi:hypothetical protein ACFP2T_43480 [Plantactinospora solaniradicis]|uniref:Uncharacterized protein n=1 Tax=Plantactinospora solaniradicis TaxID=1723736 RepID=A0ABW1KMQ2_9ACTN
MEERRSIVLGTVGRSGDGAQARSRAARRRIREILAVRRADAAAGLRTGTPDGYGPAAA